MLIRVKMSSALAKSVLDQLPNSVWTSSSTTFLDPAMGGGQFVAEIERRLLTHGHSTENVASRVFGFEENLGSVHLAVNLSKLRGTPMIGKYSKLSYTDYCSRALDMKFDVIVGNPPYQNSVNTTSKLWPKFLERSFENLHKDGYLAFVTPRAWLERPESQLSSKIVANIFAKYQLLHVDTTTERFFTISEKPCSYIIQKTPKYMTTKLITDKGTETIDYTGQKIALSELDTWKLSIFDKITKHTFPTLHSVVYTDVLSTVKIEDMLKQGIMTEAKTNNSDVKVFWTATQDNKYWMPHNKIKPGIKVIINRSGHYFQNDNPNKYIRIDAKEEYAIGVGGFGITVSTEQEARNLVSLLTTKLYRWYIDHEKTSGFNTGITKLPLLDLSKPWDDCEVFKLFNISSDEQRIIESY